MTHHDLLTRSRRLALALMTGGLVLATGCGDEDAVDGTNDDAATDTLTGDDTAGDDTAGSDTLVGDDTAALGDTAISEDTAGTDDTATAADTNVTGPPVGNPAGTPVRFEIPAFTVAPGTERQVCRTLNLSEDQAMDLVRIHSSMVGKSHHFNLYKVIDDRKFDPVTDAEFEVHDCAPADEQLSGDAAYIFGSATPERTFETPLNVAFHLEPGQRLILEQHVINFTTEPVEGGVTVDLFPAAPEATIEHHADIIWFANWGFLLPPGETSDTASCSVPYDVEVFGLMSHFHELGTNFTIDTVTGGQMTEVYQDDDWAHPTYQEFSPPLSLKAGDSLRWTCTWNNTRGTTVGPGQNSTDEMCITFAAAYPKNQLSGAPIQCNTFF